MELRLEGCHVRFHRPRTLEITRTTTKKRGKKTTTTSQSVFFDGVKVADIDTLLADLLELRPRFR